MSKKTTPWRDIRAKRITTPEAEARVAAVRRGVELQVALHELRESRRITQAAVAEHLGTSRPNVSRIEHEEDLRLSTIERYVAALGGELVIAVDFGDDAAPVQLLGPGLSVSGRDRTDTQAPIEKLAAAADSHEHQVQREALIEAGNAANTIIKSRLGDKTSSSTAKKDGAGRATRPLKRS